MARSSPRYCAFVFHFCTPGYARDLVVLNLWHKSRLQAGSLAVRRQCPASQPCQWGGKTKGRVAQRTLRHAFGGSEGSTETRCVKGASFRFLRGPSEGGDLLSGSILASLCIRLPRRADGLATGPILGRDFPTTAALRCVIALARAADDRGVLCKGGAYYGAGLPGLLAAGHVHNTKNIKYFQAIPIAPTNAAACCCTPAVECMPTAIVRYYIPTVLANVSFPCGGGGLSHGRNGKRTALSFASGLPGFFLARRSGGPDRYRRILHAYQTADAAHWSLEPDKEEGTGT
ncbi:hypothetical protein GQ53DRAFT_749271 [Thozetella sp. PMI_491]|nr:hypothetical protein GQ53DRAFT_749271 [Thozetella sp. PMI_491]